MRFILKEILVMFALLISSFVTQVNGATSSSYTIYVPDSEYMYFESKEAEYSTGSMVDQILESLHNEKVFKYLPTVNSLTIDEKYLDLDLSNEFLENLKNQGTSGEYFIMGSLVNTLIDYYDVEYVMITVNGEYIETGHALFDEYLQKFEN